MRLRRKDLIVTTLLLTLSLMIFLIGITFNIGMNHFIKDSLNQVPKNKMLVFQEKWLENPLVSEYIERITKEGLLLESGKMYYGIGGKFNKDQLVQPKENIESVEKQAFLIFEFYNLAHNKFLVSGRGIAKDDTGKIVLPLYFDTENNQKNYDNYFFEHSTLDSGTDYLGKKIIIEFMDSNESVFKKEFEVVGVYDNSKTQNETIDVLLSYNDLKTITEKISPPEILSNKNYYMLTSSFEDNENIKDSIRSIINRKIEINEIVHFDPLFEFVMISSLIAYMVSALLIAVTIIYISIITSRNVSTRKSEIGLMYSIGYSFKNIKQIFLLENLWISFIGYMITFVLYTITILYVNSKIAQEGVIDIVNLQFMIQLPICILILFAGMGLIIIATLWQLKKVNQLEITEIIKVK